MSGAAVLGWGDAPEHGQSDGEDHGARPEGVDGDVVGAGFLGLPQHAEAYTVLREGVGDVVLEPLEIEVERRREGEDVRVSRLWR
jgi:hypothetical protein